MLNASPNFRYYLAVVLLLLLGTLLALSSQAQGQPPPPSRAARAATCSRYLTGALQLPPHTYTSVYRCTLRHFQVQDSLEAGGAVEAIQQAAEHRYASALPLLTAGQYSAFVHLREQQLATTFANPLAAKQ